MKTKETRETLKDRPCGWIISIEDGADGCFPPGHYAEGLDRNGFRITVPCHTYGPYESEAEAVAITREIDAAYLIG